MTGTGVPLINRHCRAAHCGTGVPVSQCTLYGYTHTRGYPVWGTACEGKTESGLDGPPGPAVR